MSKKTDLPYHIAIIMDGNRRWAKKKNLKSIEGHKKGAEQFKKISEVCYKAGVKILTIYAFSTENWNRSKTEVAYLMKLLHSLLKSEAEVLKKNGVRLNVIGQVKRLPISLRKLIDRIIKDTADNKKGVLNIALSYGGRQEIIDAAKRMIKDKINPDKLNEKTFEKYLYTAGQPNPDLVIRTSGEMRLSNFLIWQAAYSELYFSNKMWPEFSENDFNKAIKEFRRRKRRFGK